MKEKGIYLVQGSQTSANIRITDCQAPTPEFDSVGLGWSLRIYILNSFPGDAVSAGPGITL